MQYTNSVNLFFNFSSHGRYINSTPLISKLHDFFLGGGGGGGGAFISFTNGVRRSSMGYDQIPYSKYEQKWLRPFISFNSVPFFGKSLVSMWELQIAFLFSGPLDLTAIMFCSKRRHPSLTC